MKLEIHNGTLVGTVEWRGPGEVALDIDDPEQKAWFENYFHAEETCLDGHAEAAHMSAHRRDDTEASFEHACWELAGYHYRTSASHRSP